MVAFLFAGQGAQYVGMGKDLYESFPESKAVFDKAEAVLGLDLKKRCFEGPEELLQITSVSQPAILTCSIAAFEAFKAQVKVEPQFVAGLSLGEYTALVAAGSLSLEDGLLLVKKRSEIMDAAAKKNPGKMAAVLELPFDKLKAICQETGAEIANINAPGQVVISGRAKAVEQAAKLCSEAGAKRVIELAVSGGFHSSLMLEASKELRQVLDNTPVSAPLVPVVSNYTAQPEREIGEIKENLVSQMYSSVRWEESMKFILSKGVNNFVEFGPGKVLKGILRRIDANAQVVSIEKKENILSLNKEALK
ncbi:MAG: ACP S-malonyltransferase [Candidatus Omnitrophica bacterium]|nr:ACP S-malonyltransferase [Candidatus Omnitrophota bacterium]